MSEEGKSRIEEELRRLFGPGAQVIDVKRMKRDAAKEDPELIPVKPLTLEQAKWLADHSLGEDRYWPHIGDIVRLRADCPFSNANMIFPMPGELCFVSHTEDYPDWVTKGDSAGTPLARNNMVLAWNHLCGDDDCHLEGALVEYWHDSRFFEKVGTIWDEDAKLERPVPGMK